MRRHLVLPMHFDTRAHLLREEPNDAWAEESKRLHFENRDRLLKSLRFELGPHNFDMKVENFKDAGTSPFSIISYHNIFFEQVRYAFVAGYYYPSLVGTCALGERILNHLILDLRDDFANTQQYRRIKGKQSIDDWNVAISILEEWHIWQQKGIAEEFRKLKSIRHKSIHFSPDINTTLRNDALAALGHLAKIISGQFGFAQGQDWMIEGTQGAFFIKKEYETNPFIRKYYLPQCPAVGPHYAIRFINKGRVFFDRTDYEKREISDREFVEMFNSRTENDVINPENGIEWSNVLCWTKGAFESTPSQEGPTPASPK